MAPSTADHVPTSLLRVQERAREELSRKYSSKLLKEDAILTALYSISDNNSFLLFNRDPIDRVIDYLQASNKGLSDSLLLMNLSNNLLSVM